MNFGLIGLTGLMGLIGLICLMGVIGLIDLMGLFDLIGLMGLIGLLSYPLATIVYKKCRTKKNGVFVYTKEKRGFCRLYLGTEISKNGQKPNSAFWETVFGFRPNSDEVDSYNEGLLTGNLHADRPCDADFQFLSEYEITFRNEFRNRGIIIYPKKLKI